MLRWLTLSRLRTLGLRVRDARRVAAGAWTAFGPLSLPRVTGQATDQVLAPPWARLGCVPMVFLAAVAVVVGTESARRRRGRLATALRIGEN
jgi:putative ABC transport system permease protein